MLTTWGVVLELESLDGPDPVASARRAFALGRDAYLARCPVLAETLHADAATLVVVDEQVDPLDIAAGEAVRVAVSVIEVRTTSFEMAARIRPSVSGDGRPTNGRATLAIVQGGAGERMEIPRPVRDEFIAIQLAARDLG